MTRQELHKPHRAADDLASPAPRPHLDAVAWNAAKAAEAEMIEAVAALLAKLEEASRSAAKEQGGRQAA